MAPEHRVEKQPQKDSVTDPKTDSATDNSDELPPSERPPFLKTWRQMYLLVLLTLLAVVALFAALTRIYG